MNIFSFFLFWIFCAATAYSQQVSLSGFVFSNKTGEGLSYANIIAQNTNYGTAANVEGQFELKLNAGGYKIIFSYIGFKSDTLDIELTENTFVKIGLDPVSLELGQITVLPGINPALRIIEKAVATKEKRKELINDYTFGAYSKGLVRTTRDISTRNSSVSLSIGEKDTAQLKITGVLENISKGYFKKPDNYKEEITARKQTSNFPAAINTLTGGRVIQNFYDDDVRFFNRQITSPVSKDGLSFYFYNLEDSLAYNGSIVYRIYFEPDNKFDPGFYGRLFITSDDFNLIKLDVKLNDAANPGGILTEVNIFQQFVPFENIYMPIDYRLFVEGNVLGLAKFGFELNSIMYDYSINQGIPVSFFDMSILKVLPDADIKDQAYWISSQSIPSTLEENDAYQRIDSLESLPRSVWDNFSFLSPQFNLNENLSISGPLGLYHLNKAEGSTIDFDIYASEYFGRRFNSDLNLSYGFADEKFKWDFYSEYFLGEYRTYKINFSVYDRLDVLFGESDQYNRLTTTLTSLFGKYDFKDYFYSTGFKIGIDGEVFPAIKIGAGYLNRTDKDALTKSDFSFFNRKENYDDNQRVIPFRLSAVTADFTLDPRKYIEDGYFRRRTSQGKSYFLLSGGMIVGLNNALQGAKLNTYNLNLIAEILSFSSTRLNIRLKGIYATGAVPLQLMYALPGNIKSIGQDFTFRTLSFNEIFGDRVFTAGMQYNFNEELFRLSGLRFFQKLRLSLTAHFNAAWLSTSEDSRLLNEVLLNSNPVEFKKPFFEIGFGIGQALTPLKFEFSWKLNHFGKNNFVFGINSVLL